MFSYRTVLFFLFHPCLFDNVLMLKVAYYSSFCNSEIVKLKARLLYFLKSAVSYNTLFLSKKKNKMIQTVVLKLFQKLLKQRYSLTRRFLVDLHFMNMLLGIEISRKKANNENVSFLCCWSIDLLKVQCLILLQCRKQVLL